MRGSSVPRAPIAPPLGQNRLMPIRYRTVIPVWAMAVVAPVLIGVLVPPADHLQAMTIAMALLVILTFALQLAVVQKEGLVDRMMASLGGSVVILAIGTAVLAIISAA